MRLFNLFCNFENPAVDITMSFMYLFLFSCLFLAPLIVGVFFFSSGSLLSILEITAIIFFFLFGISTFNNFHIPVFFISRKYNYLTIISDYSNGSQGALTEDFFPPFKFGYRNYFLAKAPRWWDFWSISLKNIDRRINSSVFEWGYIKRVPTYHYYIVRGGERIKRLVSNNFKRVTGTTHDSPIWVYTFKPKRRKYGWTDSSWGEWVYKWQYNEMDEASEHLLYNYHRIRTQNMRLSNWLEKWSTSQNPKVVNSDYFLSGNRSSPYSYDNFRFKFLKFPNISFVHKPTKLGFRTADDRVKLPSSEEVSRRMNRYLDYVQSFNPSSLKFPVSSKEKMAEEGDFVLLDREDLFHSAIFTAFASYDVHPHIIPHGERSPTYWYAQYWRIYAYNSLTEFWAFIFESLYIYPFQKRWVNTRISLEYNNFFTNENILSFNFFELFEYLVMTGINIYWISFFFVYFIIFLAIFKMPLSLLRYFFRKEN